MKRLVLAALLVALLAGAYYFRGHLFEATTETRTAPRPPPAQAVMADVATEAPAPFLITIDDPGTFNQPWQALRQYDRVNRAFTEDACSENNAVNPFGIDYGTPVAEKPDF